MMRPGSKGILWVIAALLIALVPQIPRMPLFIVAITLAPVAWRLIAELKNWNPLPKLVRHGATVVSLIALVTSYGSLFGRRASVSLLAAMLALKLLECERIRDARLVISFSFFLCATQFLFTQGILMPVYGVATIIAGLVALAQLQRIEAFEPAGETPSLQVSMIADLAFSLRLLLLAIPIGIAFFLFFPRWASPLWGVPETTLDAKSGLSDSMSPGSIQSLFMDDSPALRAEFEGAAPLSSQLYWRGPVFWHYDDNTWTGSFYGRNIRAESMPDPETAPWRYSVQLEPNERNWLFALDYPASTPADTRITLDFQLMRRQPVTQLLAYRMVSNPDYVDAPELKSTLRSMALELPDRLNPRTWKMVRQWRTQIPDDRDFVRQVLNYFNQEDFHYSLQAPLLGRHAVDEFLFETRVGYCEHYASAFAVMMRMAGIPSRVVTGYQGGWYSELGNYVLVRQSDAHAWAEVWLQGSGWTRTDPTAAVSPLRVQQGSLGALSAPRHLLDFNWMRNLRNGVDLLEQRWNDWIIEFGAQRQARMFASLGLDYMSPAGLVTVLFAFLGLIGLFLLPLILKTVGPGSKDPVQLAWERFARRLQKAGCQFQPSHGAMELADSAAVILPANSATIFYIAELYNRYRYAPQAPETSELLRALKHFRPKKMAS